MFAEGLGVSEDASVSIHCTLRYNGDEYYPEAFLYGINFKVGALDNITEDTNLEDIR